MDEAANAWKLKLYQTQAECAAAFDIKRSTLTHRLHRRSSTNHGGGQNRLPEPPTSIQQIASTGHPRTPQSIRIAISKALALLAVEPHVKESTRRSVEQAIRALQKYANKGYLAVERLEDLRKKQKQTKRQTTTKKTD